MVEFFDFNKIKNKYFDDIMIDISKVVNHGVFINSSDVFDFELRCERYLNSENFIGVSSGTDALLISMMAAGLTSGDEVLTTSFTFVATAMTALRLGCSTKFVDVERNSFHPSYDDYVSAVTDKTRAIVYVHLFGEAKSDILKLSKFCKKNNIILIEDCAQSFGSKINNQKYVGTIGDFGTYSFFPTKNLPCFGDGGGVSVNNLKYLSAVKKIKSHGYERKYYSEMIGGNFRLDSIQAAIMCKIINSISALNNSRVSNAAYYLKNIKNDCIKLPTFAENSTWNQFCVTVKNRKHFLDYLKWHGVGCNVYYPIPLHKLPVFKSNQNLPLSEQLSNSIVALPIYPGIDVGDLGYVANCLNEYKYE